MTRWTWILGSLFALALLGPSACGDSSGQTTGDTAPDLAGGDATVDNNIPVPTMLDDGEPCTSGDDCASGRCMGEDEGFPGGHCTTFDCLSREDCSGLGRACLQGEFNGNLCVALCSEDSDCREGYECSGREDGGYCYPPFVAEALEPSCDSELVQQGGLVTGFFEPMDLHRIEFDVSDDAASFAVMVYNRRDQVLPSRLVAPSGDALSLLDEYFFFSTTVINLGNIAPVFLPAGSEWLDWVQGGHWTMEVGTTGDEVCFFVLENPALGRIVDLNFYFVGVPGLNAMSADRDPDFQEMLDFFDETLDIADISLGTVRYFDVTGDIEDEFEVIRTENEVFELMSLSRAPGQSREHLLSVNVFFVRGFAGNMFSVLGVAPGVPAVMGIHGQTGTGLIFSAENLGRSDGNRLVGQVLAHELGHYLGLAHTTELRGGTVDWLQDTPSCPNIRRESLQNCPDFENLMFPIASFRDTVSLSDDQILVMKSNPLVTPTDSIE